MSSKISLNVKSPIIQYLSKVARVSKNKFDVRKLKEFDNHKLVVKIEDKKAGLKGFIAIHNNNLGSPAVGGTRMFPYRSETEALKDVLNLSRTMTYKCTLAKVHYGGAKGVIVGNPKKDKTKELLKSYAKAVNLLKGEFYTGEDSGINQEDVKLMLRFSDYFIGRPGLAEDPSPYAALSTFCSIQSALYFALKKKSLKDIKVAIKGVGKTGRELIRLLYNAGVKIYASDVDKKVITAIKKEFPKVTIVDNKKIYTLAVDVYSPCALGDEFSMKRARQVRAKLICGTANNQLTNNKVGDWFFKHNIVYIPDYLANCGGLIAVVDELAKDGYKRSRVLKKINRVKDVVKKILTLSSKTKKSPQRIADEMAEKYFHR